MRIGILFQFCMYLLPPGMAAVHDRLAYLEQGNIDFSSTSIESSLSKTKL